MRLAILPLLFASGTVFAAGNMCGQLVQQPTVALEMGKPTRQYRHDQTLEELTAQARASGTPVREGGVVSGLTTDRRRVQVKAWYSIAQLQSGYCLSPQAKIVIDQRVVTVAMPAEIPSNSCFFQVTLDHEHKHARIAEEMMDRVIREEVSAIQSSLYGQAGFQQTLSDAQSKINRLQANIERRIYVALDRVDRLNGAIDTPEEYARVNSTCKSRPETKPASWWKRIFG